MRFAFVSGNRAWSGSEELWSATAAVLASDGHRVAVYKSGVDESEPRIQRLRALSCTVRDLARFPLMPRGVFTLLRRLSQAAGYAHETLRLLIGLTLSRRPDLVVISQGGNFDGAIFGDVCRRRGLPFVLVSQKASEIYWPGEGRRKHAAAVYGAARAAFFVARHNVRLTEEQLGIDLSRATVVRNPFLVPWESDPGWPDDREAIRLACVGRLHPTEKGQDMLLRVLARPHWRSRAISVSFFGEGLQRGSLEALAARLDLDNVTFAGFTRDVAAIWREHHGLILPSRCEGMPLALVEAMLSARVPIVTAVGGIPEIVADGETGWVAAAPTEDALDEAMERAWNARHRWREVGKAAAASIRTLVPPEPERCFAQQLLDLAGAKQGQLLQ